MKCALCTLRAGRCRHLCFGHGFGSSAPSPPYSTPCPATGLGGLCGQQDPRVRGAGVASGSFVLEFGFRERALGLALVGTRTYRAVELAPRPSPAVSLCRAHWLRKALKSCFTCIVVHPLWDLPQQKAQGWFHAAPWWCQLGFAVSAWLLTSAVILLMESSA